VSEELTIADLSLIQEALNHTIKAISDYRGYPDYAYKRTRLDEVEAVKAKVIALRKSIKAGAA